ncbi:hypothetical protein [Nocardioides dongkuii]|uniref:hypothetical protein n=1 Tax=Nocardioides dongkuii TaxID=2760089 RepID=UPI0015F89854|nr:hypothetical protein [Nocardioides dongkuii]
MSDLGTPWRVAAFVAALAVVLAASVGIGRAVGPVDAEPAEHAAEGHGSAGHDTPEAPAAAVAGLSTSAAGYTLALADDRLAPGRRTLALTVTGPDGAAVTAYDVQHEKELHLVVVRRDLTGFQHVHPVLDRATGEWTVDVDLTPGAWRVVADLDPADGDPVVLGTDLLVSGRQRPVEVGEQRLADSVDGYDVTLGGSLVAGAETELSLTVSRDGEPVTDLQPYLGAYGHLVAIRAGDLGYLHVHPEDGAPGPAISFHTAFPDPGAYRLFLDFRHGGEVHTATFTVHVGEGHGHDGGHDEGGAGHDH